LSIQVVFLCCTGAVLSIPVVFLCCTGGQNSTSAT
jgi:hypothetical protein